MQLTRTLPTVPVATLAVYLMAGAAPAQSVLVPDSTVRTVASLSAADGSLEAAGFMDLDEGALPTNRPYAGALVGSELWFTDDVLGRITRWNSFGSTQLGEIDLTPHRLRGITVAFGSVWVAAGNPSATVQDYLVQLTPAGALVALHPMPGLVNGVTQLGAQLLVAIEDSDSLQWVDPVTGAITGTFVTSNGVSTIDAPGEIDALANGHVLAGGGLPPYGVYEYDAQGNQVRYIDTTSVPNAGSVRGVHGVANGDIVFSAGTGLFRWSSGTGQIEQLAGSLVLYYFNEVPSIPLGVYECGPAVPNSTGRPGTTSAVGSALLADGAVRLCAQDLPFAATGYFLCSRTAGHVPNAGASQGTLCLGGTVGRFNQQVGFTGNDGFFSVTVNPASVPQPTGTIAIVAGETWRFQCWYRDANPTVTSNFTNAMAVTFH